MITAMEAAKQAKKLFHARLADPREVWGAPYGIPSLDKITGGVQSKECVFLLGDSGMGKSSILGQFAVSIGEWLQQSKPGWEVRLVTLEMDAWAWISRAAAGRAGIPLSRIRNGFAKEQKEGVSREFIEKQKALFDKEADYIAGLPIRFIDITTVERLDDIRTQIAQPVDGMKCAWWALDHLQHAPGGGGDAIQMAETVRYLSDVCHEVASGLILSQINNDVQGREDKRPTLNDTFGTKKPKQVADWMFALFRDDKYTAWPEDRKDDPRPAEVLILKSRYGEDGLRVKMWLMKDRMLWVEREEKRR